MKRVNGALDYLKLKVNLKVMNPVKEGEVTCVIFVLNRANIQFQREVL